MGRNEYLNPAFKPKWLPVDEPNSAAQAAMTPQGDTRFDPFQGTGWGRFFDSVGGKIGPGSLAALPDSTTLAQSGADTQRTSYGPFGAMGAGTGGNVPTGEGPQTEGPYGRLKKAVKGIK